MGLRDLVALTLIVAAAGGSTSFQIDNDEAVARARAYAADG